MIPCDAEPPYPEESSPAYQPTAPSSSSVPSTAPPPFSSLYSTPSAPPDRLKACITEPDSSPPPAFSPAPALQEAVPEATTAEAETKAALPADTKGESSSKAAEESEPPPPYTEGSSPIDSFTYVMAAAGGPTSIITQASQGVAAPVNTLAGKVIVTKLEIKIVADIFVADVGADEHITLDLR